MGLPVGTRFSSGYSFAASISVRNHDNATVRDASLDVPEDWDEFWAAVEDTTDGFDIIVVDPTTNEIVDYQISAFDYATRLCTIEMDDVTEASAVTHLWLYCGNADFSDLTTSFAHVAGAPAFVELGVPAKASLVIDAGRHTGRTPPEDVVTKGTAEVVYVWLDVAGAMTRRQRPYNGSRGYEAIVSASMVVHLAGAPQATMVDAGQLRIVESGRLVRALLKGGTVDTDYTGVITVVTTLGRTLEYRYLVQIRNPQEA